jgi:hypothetical protein
MKFDFHLDVEISRRIVMGFAALYPSYTRGQVAVHSGIGGCVALISPTSLWVRIATAYGDVPRATTRTIGKLSKRQAQKNRLEP